MAGHPPLFFVGDGHLFFAFRQPQRAAAAPRQLSGIRGVIARQRSSDHADKASSAGSSSMHQMAHTGRRGAGLTVIDQRHALPPLRQLPRAGGADDPGADHDDVALLHGAIPQQKDRQG